MFTVQGSKISHHPFSVTHYLAISCGNEDIKGFLAPTHHTESMETQPCTLQTLLPDGSEWQPAKTQAVSHQTLTTEGWINTFSTGSI
jgi:hypothetical protein